MTVNPVFSKLAGARFASALALAGLPEEVLERLSLPKSVRRFPCLPAWTHAALRVPQRGSQGEAGAPAPHPRRAPATTTAAARTGAAPCEVPVLRQAHAARRPHRTAASVACAFEPSQAPARPTSIKRMNPAKTPRHPLPGQRATLAGESAPAKRKTAPSSPPAASPKLSKSNDRRHATGRITHTAADDALERQAAPEANRIRATRSVEARP